ncbi:MAG: glycosyltransferase family 1 protein, partial [Acidimicrobiales bacterium]
VNARMRLLVVAEQLRRPAPGGIGTYARGLLKGIAGLDEGDRPEVELLASRPPGGTHRADPLVELGRPVRTSALPGVVLTRAWDHGLLRAPSDADVVHAVSLSTLVTRRAPLVVTVHDLLWRTLPDAYPARGRQWHESALRRALARADRFVVPSDEVALELSAEGAPREVVSVIPMGSDHLPPPDHTAAAARLARLGVRGPFLLSVGTLEPRKNQVRLLQAYSDIRSRLPDGWSLVLVGPEGWGDRITPPPGVVLAGTVPAAELAALYSRARLLAYVPLVEGFGLPPVEAMALGAPVVASPLPSTVGAAFEVDPCDVDSIGEGILRVAVDDELRADLVRRGKDRTSGLTWSSIARSHLAVWRAARETVDATRG